MNKRIRLLTAALAIGSVALIHVGSAAEGEARPAEIIHEYILPSFSLEYFGYSAAELTVAQADGLTTTDHPAIGSGLQRIAGNHYLSVTDRGPNADRADGTKAFPLPQFTPTIVLSKAVNNQIIPLDLIPIVNDLGQGVQS